MKTQHTHRGICQWCGALQAVDNKTGKLAKHGYTKEYGFFNGTCTGSGHEPLQVSCELVKQSIVWASSDRAKTLAHAAELRAEVGPKALVSHYLPVVGDRRGRKSYQLVPSEFYAVHAVLQSGYEYDQLWVRFEHGGKEINQQDRGSMAGSVEELAARHREYRAKEQDERAAQLARYIANQNAVVDGWKPFDLVPVK